MKLEQQLISQQVAIDYEEALAVITQQKFAAIP